MGSGYSGGGAIFGISGEGGGKDGEGGREGGGGVNGGDVSRTVSGRGPPITWGVAIVISTTAGASGFMSGIALETTSIFESGCTGTATATNSIPDTHSITLPSNSFTTTRPWRTHSTVIAVILHVPT